MKTPREILLQKHQAAEPKLDRIRQEILAELLQTAAPEKSRAPERVSFFLKLWLELILPARRIWLGLAAIWIVILAVNFSSNDEPRLAGNAAAPDAQTIAELKEQKLLMAQLLGLNDADADKPKSIAPRPRSEKRFEQMIG